MKPVFVVMMAVCVAVGASPLIAVIAFVCCGALILPLAVLGRNGWAEAVTVVAIGAEVRLLMLPGLPN